MPRIHLPPGCNGFADGDKKYLSAKPGGTVYLDDVKDANALKKLKNQDYASAGLVDAGPEKLVVRKPGGGRWCKQCNFLGHAWTKEHCGQPTIPEEEMDHPEFPKDINGGMIL